MLGPSPHATSERSKSCKAKETAKEKGHGEGEICPTSSPPQKGEGGIPVPEVPPLTSSNSSNDSEDNPMVSEAIGPFTIKSKIVVPETEPKGK